MNNLTKLTMSILAAAFICVTPAIAAETAAPVVEKPDIGAALKAKATEAVDQAKQDAVNKAEKKFEEKMGIQKDAQKKEEVVDVQQQSVTVETPQGIGQETVTTITPEGAVTPAAPATGK